jgi:bifunctional DNA-binding transcriptional regulator/antitoxin component of YhaV-PrlF toxin-antitoxin module
MILSKLSPKRQVVVPEDVCKVLGAESGDYIEFVKRNNEIVIRAKKLVDATSLNQPTIKPLTWNDIKSTLPPAQSREDRLAMLKALQGNAIGDSEDIDVDLIKASRTSSDKVVEFD